MERLNIDKVYHPFITGAHNKLVGELMQETGARINVPPPSVNKTEIVITGEKEQVALAMAKIKKIYEEKVGSASPPGVLPTQGTIAVLLLFVERVWACPLCPCRRRRSPPSRWR